MYLGPAGRQRTQYQAGPGLTQSLALTLRDGAAHYDPDVFGLPGLEFLDQFGNQAFMFASRGQKTNEVNIIFNCHPGGVPGRLLQRADIDIKARFGKIGGQQLGVAIMFFLPHAADQYPRPPPFPYNKSFNSVLDQSQYSISNKLNFPNYHISNYEATFYLKVD